MSSAVRTVFRMFGSSSMTRSEAFGIYGDRIINARARDLTPPTMASTFPGMRNAASFLVAAGAAVMALALTACPKKKPKDPTCDSDEDCKDGLKCVDKKCQEAEEKP